MLRSRFGRTALAIALLGTVAVAVAAGLIYRLPTVGSELRSDANELAGKRWTVPGETGFWISYPVHSVSPGQAGGGAEISWVAREGFKPTLCRQGCVFDDCWGGKLSTIEGNSWTADRKYYTMTGRLYYHYKPVANGAPGSVAFQGQSFVKDAATCAGDFTGAR